MSDENDLARLTTDILSSLLAQFGASEAQTH
jgi:hypothetical protein